MKTNKDDVPESNVVIDQCGVWTDDMPVPIFNASYDTIGGIYMKNILKMIIQISTKNPLKKHLVWHQNQRKWYFVFKKGDKENARFKYIKALRYIMEFIPDPDQDPEWYKNS